MAIINGYIVEYQPKHPRATTSGMVYQHIIKAEEKIGRPLKKEEVVHHINGIRSDNRFDNLLVFASNGDHAAFHKFNIYELDEEGIAHCSQRITRNDKGNAVHPCKRCGEMCDYQAEYCKPCRDFLQRKAERPTRIELKQMIRSSSFTAIGSAFGVTDNAIRKWCDAYNLPRHSREIKKYSDEEWETI